MPKMGSQRRKAAGRKGAKVKAQLRGLAAQDVSEEEKRSALWEAQPVSLQAMPIEGWEGILRHAKGLLGQIHLLARLVATCRAMRCVELELGSWLDWRVLLARGFVTWRRTWERGRTRQKLEAARQRAVEEEEEEDRAILLTKLMPVYGEVSGRERELARMLGARSEPPMLRVLVDNAFRDAARTGSPDSTHGLARAFPQLAAVYACTGGWEHKEIAAFVRSMLVRAGVAPRRMLHRPCHLRVPGV